MKNKSKKKKSTNSSTVEKLNMYVDGMSCLKCEQKIALALAGNPNVIRFEVSLITTKIHIAYDSSKITYEEIDKLIDDLGYHLVTKSQRKRYYVFVLLFLVVAVTGYLIIQNVFGISISNVDPDAALITVFLIGLLSSFHCVAMCGGICLSQCVPKVNQKNGIGRDLLYNLGRLISYSLMGLIIGLFGSVLNFSSVIQGLIKIVAGLLMLIIGINNLNIFPFLRKVIPTMPPKIKDFMDTKLKNKTPFIVGLLNVLIPCAPLLSMQLYALGTGDALTGMFAMALFCLGTIPTMFIFGLVGSISGKKFKRILGAVSAVLVTVMGFFMFSNGFSLVGVNFSAGGSGTSSTVSGDTQSVSSSVSRTSYGNITVKQGMKVNWTINAASGVDSSCIRYMVVPEFNINKTLQSGTNQLSFTPNKKGNFVIRCQMGMYTGKVTVVSNTSGSGSLLFKYDSVGLPKPINYLEGDVDYRKFH